MPYTEEEGGRLNNFASEPKTYAAKPPTKKQQINYAIGGLLALLLVSGVVFIAFSVS